MRSSNKRSRNKNNRRSVGNIVNRVFDSSGPEGKVRGTPQQIIEKYQTLARDAQLANDRVAVENFQQHAEHYTRMLAEAMREQEARREQQEQQQNRNRPQQSSSKEDAGSDQPGADDRQPSERRQQDDAAFKPKPKRDAGESHDDASKSSGSEADVIDLSDSVDSGLVDTPESAPARKPRRTRRKKSEMSEGETPSGEAAEAPAE